MTQGSGSAAGRWDSELAQLSGGRLFAFADWPVPDVPNGAGVYTIWRSADFLYVGMAGRGDTQDSTVAVATGLRRRLNSHASGRRSGDQFCVDICDRFVLPRLASVQIQAIGEGTILLDELTRELVRTELGFRFVIMADAYGARDLEKQIRVSGLPGVGQPFLNPGSTPD